MKRHIYTAEIANAHRQAMTAKSHVFLAQDALSRSWSEIAVVGGPQDQVLRRRLEKALAKVRAELEKLDNVMLAARRAGLIDEP